MNWLDFLRGLFRPRPNPPPNPRPPITPTPSPGNDPLAAVNAERAREGLEPLAYDAALQAAAASWASQMATTGVLTHGDFLGRISAIYPNAPASENIAQGQTSAIDVVDDWATSPGHKRNMLGPYSHAGMASATGPGGPWWVCDFVKLEGRPS